MKPREKTISGKELLAQVAANTGDYYAYEVADILNSLAASIAKNAKKGYSTTIKGIGTFTPKNGYPLKSKSNITGSEFEVVTKNSLSLKIDSYMRNMLNEQVETKNMLNQPENNEVEFNPLWEELKQELNLTDEDLDKDESKD